METGILHRVDHPADALVRRVDVAADMHFGEVIFGDVLRAADILKQLFQLGLPPFEKLARIHQRLPTIAFARQLGSASGRDSMVNYVKNSVVAEEEKKNK